MMRPSPTTIVLTMAMLMGGTLQAMPVMAGRSQAVSPPPAPLVLPGQHDATGHLVLPVNTQVPMTIDAELASNKVKVGDTFALSVERDVMVGGAIVIPRGTHAIGAVKARSGKGALGKSGKMEVEIRSLDLNGRVVALTGSGRQAGKGNGAATLGTLLLLGPFAAAVTGTSARFRKGRVFTAYTSEPIVVTSDVAAPASVPAPAT